ncbi:MAG: 6,7-dimethyl-8-ribityllumazine synthase [Alloprevotella sp.]|nr:6,7-dimethyl-8-ribityllumazine synthase [Alloprevotella sp.]
MSSTFTYTADQGQPVPDASEMRFGVVVTEWNNDITDKLLDGTLEELSAQGVPLKNVTVKRVPGSFELVYAAAQLAKFGHVNGIIILGCVIKGDTPHFDYICQGVTEGIARINAQGDIPVIFGLLTVLTHEQAEERAGGRLGNKGKEFALTAIKMVDYAWKLQK